MFEFHGSETLKDTFREVRNKPDKYPQWLDEAILNELWVLDFRCFPKKRGML